MLKLSQQGLQNREEWIARHYELPGFDRQAMIQATSEAPVWVHFGAGNIFRAFQCAAAQKMLNAGDMKTGIIAVEGFDYEIIEKGYWPCDNYSLLVTLKADGRIDLSVIASVAESINGTAGDAAAKVSTAAVKIAKNRFIPSTPLVF